MTTCDPHRAVWVRLPSVEWLMSMTIIEFASEIAERLQEITPTHVVSASGESLVLHTNDGLETTTAHLVSESTEPSDKDWESAAWRLLNAFQDGMVRDLGHEWPAGMGPPIAKVRDGYMHLGFEGVVLRPIGIR